MLSGHVQDLVDPPLRGWSPAGLRYALILLGVTGLLRQTAAADDGSSLMVRTSKTTGHAAFITARGGGAITLKDAPAAAAGAAGAAARAKAFLGEHGGLFGISDPAEQLILRGASTDRIGHTQHAYEQTYKGVRVFSGVIKVHENSRGQIVAANGRFYPINPKLNTVATWTPDAAAALARADLNLPGAITERNELVIVDPGWYGDPPMGEQLAYYIVLKDAEAAIREGFFVDAHRGVVLDRWSMIHGARSRRIYDGNYTGSLPGTLRRNEGMGPVGVYDVDAAYDYAGDVYDYFLRAFGRDSFDGLGSVIRVTVRSTAPTCPNAYWDGAQMVFCAGLVTDDILAHELTHAVTQYTANLIYQNQSGQLNESFSDIFGELVDLFNGNAAFVGQPGGTPAWPAHPTGPGNDSTNGLRSGCGSGVRWLIGEDGSGFGGAIRDMWNPGCYSDPDRANSPLQTCASNDAGGVHTGSGVPNHAFAMLTDGKIFNGYTVAGIGPIKAGAVWYRALTTYLTPASDFKDAYYALNQAAADLVGTWPNDPRTGLPSASVFTSFDAEQVDKALRATEMNTDGRCGANADVLDPAPPRECAGRAMIFRDDMERGTNGWTVSNSNPPTPYNWVLRSGQLPYNRGGTAWFCDDPNLGNCSTLDESGVHYLTSPLIVMPPVLRSPALVFTHYIAVETGWDGGNVQYRVAGGAWKLIPKSAFRHNPYNTTLNGPPTNTNPLKSQAAWSGAGGPWGTSLVDLSSLVAGGQTLQVRFAFGKDGCTGVDGWYIDDFAVYICVPGDMDGDGDIDQADFGLLQACYTGPAVPVADPSCQAANMDGDADVDMQDFDLFQRCMSGANTPVDANCAN